MDKDNNNGDTMRNVERPIPNNNSEFYELVQKDLDFVIVDAHFQQYPVLTDDCRNMLS